MEDSKEACKKQVERRLHTLVEVANQLEGSSPTKEDEEVEKVVCPACEEMFNQSGYIVILRAFGTQNPTPAIEEEQEAPNAQVRNENKLEVGLILDIEVEEAEKLQSQPSELIDQPNEGNIEANQGANTQEPAPSEIFVEAGIEEEIGKLDIEVIPNPNLEVLSVTQEPS